jgi:hypothetical protein
MAQQYPSCHDPASLPYDPSDAGWALTGALKAGVREQGLQGAIAPLQLPVLDHADDASARAASKPPPRNMYMTERNTYMTRTPAAFPYAQVQYQGLYTGAEELRYSSGQVAPSYPDYLVGPSDWAARQPGPAAPAAGGYAGAQRTELPHDPAASSLPVPQHTLDPHVLQRRLPAHAPLGDMRPTLGACGVTDLRSCVLPPLACLLIFFLLILAC